MSDADAQATAATLQAISKARTALLMHLPFYGTAAMSLPVRLETENCDTAYTDGQKIAFNPAFVATLSKHELQGLIAHEVLHVTNLHHVRQRWRNARIWNEACDFAINGVLSACGVVLPKGALLDESRFKGLSAEAIYEIIKDEPRAEEAPGGVRPSKTPAAEETARVKQVVVRAVKAAKRAGDLSDDLARHVDEALRERLEWRALLLRFAQNIAQSADDWMRPRSVWMQQGVVMPTQRTPAMGLIVVAIDTSGSITDAYLGQVCAALEDIMASVEPERLRVMCCDSQVRSTVDFYSGDSVSLKLVGGGGTRFEPVFDAIREEGEEPACLLYFTDGRGDFKFSEPDYPVLWVVQGNVIPPWGECVRVD